MARHSNPATRAVVDTQDLGRLLLEYVAVWVCESSLTCIMAVLQTRSGRYDPNDVACNRNVTNVRPYDISVCMYISYHEQEPEAAQYPYSVHKYSFGYARFITTVKIGRSLMCISKE